MKHKAILALLAVVLAAGLVISGCGKKENPFEPTTSNIAGTVGPMASVGPQVTSIATIAGGTTFYKPPTYDEIRILFNKDINPATVGTGTILVQEVPSMVAAPYTVTYEPGDRKAVIRTTQVWDTMKRYLVTVTASVRDLHGNPLDGNGNNFVDPQDYRRQQFVGATCVTAPYDQAGPTVALIYPADNAYDIKLTDSVYVRIADADSVDPTTLVAANFRLTTESGAAVALPPAQVTETVTPQREYLVVFRSLGLAQATNYYFTATTGIKDRKGNTLDGNGNGVSEAESIDRKIVKFRTYDPANAVPSLKVVSATTVDANRNLSIRFNRKMNAGMLTSTYIKLFDKIDKTGHILGTLRVHPDTMGVNYSLENAPANTNYLWVSQNIQAANGYRLDQNGNNIAGEAAWTVVNGVSKPSDAFWGAIDFTTGTRYILLDDNAETLAAGWSAQRMWHRTTMRAYQGLYSWKCGNDADSSYIPTPPTPVAVHDTLFLPAVDLTGWANARIYYARWYRTDGAADVVSLLSSTNNGATWTSVFTWFGNASAWNSTNLTLTPGAVTRYAFAFDTDAVGNANPNEGTYWDNISIQVW